MAARQLLFAMPPIVNRRPRTYRPSNLQDLNEAELRARYRFGSEALEFLSDLLRDDLKRGTNKATALTVEKQIKIALRFYASGSFLQVVGDTQGADKGTVSRVIEDVTDALLSKKNQFVKWPVHVEQQRRVKNGFYQMAHFPNVLGCIDCTHVRIQAPSGPDEPSFVNRKRYHSINVQAVCDHEGKFTQFTANWPGSVHDAHIFRTSNLSHHLETNHRAVDGILLGDSGYGCRPFLLTPFSNPQQRYQQRYNSSHASTRSTIERTFGIWKRRFHVLHSEIRMKPDKVCRIIGACAVLHNIAVQFREPLEDDDDFEVDDPYDGPQDGPQDGRAFREHVARTFFY